MSELAAQVMPTKKNQCQSTGSAQKKTSASPLGQRGKKRPPLCFLCLLPGLGFSPRGHQLSVLLLGRSPGMSAGFLPLFGVWAQPAPTPFPSLPSAPTSPASGSFSLPSHLLLPEPLTWVRLCLRLRLLAPCFSPCVELTDHLLQNMWLERGKRGFAIRRGRWCAPRALEAACHL